jgi:hypothetical protein
MYQIISIIWFEKLYNKYGLYRIDRTHYCVVSCMTCSMYRNYNQCENDECQNCTLNVTENCFHVMFVCPKYKLLRHHFLKCYNLPQTLARYYDYFEEMDSEKVKLTYNYVRCMLNIRVTWFIKFIKCQT